MYLPMYLLNKTRIHIPRNHINARWKWQPASNYSIEEIGFHKLSIKTSYILCKLQGVTDRPYLNV